jgi:D-alanyl-D-alanine carboxypeptidase
LARTADPVAHVGRYVERHLERMHAPGVAVGLTDREQLLGVVTRGFANLPAKQPVRREHLFQIGSISKSFTAIAVLQEHEAGRLELHAPVTTYLPWFDVSSPGHPVTVHHLLSHTSGLPTGHDFSTEGLPELLALREVGAGFAPGSRFHYSNAGYKALGLILEAVAGQPWWELARVRILEPLGMLATDPITAFETSRRSATGHWGPFDDRPWHPSHGLVTAPWIESSTADGTICSTAEDMCAYLRMLLAQGAPALSPESFGLLARRVVEDPDTPGEFYGYGLRSKDVGGHRRIGHTGSVVGFTAAMEIDVDDGVGVVALANANAERGELVRFALDTLAAAGRGDALPDIADPAPQDHVEGAEAYAGTFRSDDGELELVARGGLLLLSTDGGAVALFREEGDRFVVPHPAFELFPLTFERMEGRVTAVAHGERWWAIAGTTASVAPPPDPEGATGHWRAHNPWYPNFRIVARRGALHLIWGWGEEDWELVPVPRGGYRVGGEDWSPGRISFDTAVDGVVTRAVFDGAPYYRTTTP